MDFTWLMVASYGFSTSLVRVPMTECLIEIRTVIEGGAVGDDERWVNFSLFDPLHQGGQVGLQRCLGSIRGSGTLSQRMSCCRARSTHSLSVFSHVIRVDRPRFSPNWGSSPKFRATFRPSAVGFGLPPLAVACTVFHATSCPSIKPMYDQRLVKGDA